MLGLARRMLLRTLAALRSQIRQGIPVIGLEPGCISVFRDEMGNLLYGDQDAARMRDNTFLLSEFLAGRVPDYRPPHLSSDALVHGHCHHKAILNFDREKALLRDMGLNAQVLDSGCCGMAGAFGYETEHYETGLKCGERVLLPAVRNAPASQMVIADGFSCREMIRQETGRKAVHLAQVLQMGLRAAGHTAPEIPGGRRRPPNNHRPGRWLLAGAAAAAIAYAAVRAHRSTS
jgi:Fe-S oxidoreductase